MSKVPFDQNCVFEKNRHENRELKPESQFKLILKFLKISFQKPVKNYLFLVMSEFSLKLRKKLKIVILYDKIHYFLKNNISNFSTECIFFLEY